MRLPLAPEALAELEAAATRYERERPGYGELFIADVRERVERAARLPRSGRSVPGFDSTRDVRSFGLKRFPYLVVTALVRKERAVIAVAHTSREPAYWRDRTR